MAADLFQFLVILSVAILILTFTKCLLTRDRGHVIYMNSNANLKKHLDSPILTEVYYGALDKDSEEFIIKQLKPTYELTSDIMDVVLVPFGTTKMMKGPIVNYDIECVQRPTACEANLLHACIVDELKADTHQQLSLIVCIWEHGSEVTPREAFMKCFSTSGGFPNVSSSSIMECLDSARGMDLLHRNGEMTKASNKKHLDLPFVIFNGSLKMETNRIVNLLKEICQLASKAKSSKKICKDVKIS